jgi:hypothetical protein
MTEVELTESTLLVHDPQKALSINLAHEHYTKLVIEVTDPADEVAGIEEAVRKSS